jgi:hypothetical protein
MGGKGRREREKDGEGGGGRERERDLLRPGFIGHESTDEKDALHKLVSPEESHLCVCACVCARALPGTR